jgi:hypothetical protein
MKKLILLFTVLSLQFSVSSAAAQAPTASSASAEQIKEAVRKQVEQEVATIRKNTTRKGFVGSVVSKNETGIVMTNLKNVTKTLTIPADAVIRLAGGKDGSINDIKKDDFIIAMGDSSTPDSMTVKRLLVISKPVSDKRKVVFAKVTKTSPLTVENPSGNVYVIKSSSSSLPKLKVDDQIIIIASSITDTSIVAKQVKLAL